MKKYPCLIQITSETHTSSDIKNSISNNKDQCMSCGDDLLLTSGVKPALKLVISLDGRRQLKIWSLICQTCADRGEGYFVTNTLNYLEKIGLIDGRRDFIGAGRK